MRGRQLLSPLASVVEKIVLTFSETVRLKATTGEAMVVHVQNQILAQ